MAAGPVITIQMGETCEECRKPGRLPNGLCMSCTARAMKPGVKLKTAHGRAVQTVILATLKKGKR